MRLVTELPTDVNSRDISNTSVLITKNYSDATYTYVCNAIPDSGLSAEVWRIKRVTLADGSTGFAGGAVTFVNAATDLATVQAYSYS